MLRYRRYRGFIACAAIVIFLLYHVSKNSQWEAVPSSFPADTKFRGTNPVIPKPNDDKVDIPAKKVTSSSVSDKSSQGEAPLIAPGKGEDRAQDAKIPELKADTAPHGAYVTGMKADVATKTREDAADRTAALQNPAGQTTKAAAVDLPDRRPGPVEDLYQDATDEVHIGNPPGAHEGKVLIEPTTIHWEKPTERFPIPEESLISLPTGKPKVLPTVQAKFKLESPEAKKKRLFRRDRVREEAQHAWRGYKTFAWTHDELKPVTNASKDPFCGWAATLVDSLDTLWIMGMKEDFEEAVKAVKEIDFTTTPYRSDIPVFETTIRYLGGLLAAYDVSGGHSGNYRILLDKALELAEILMGVFDTPNRMPILYYNWKTTFSSNPKRASTSASVAELGSLAMEFTRLAQLTGKAKYYDAIARITDAFEEYQNRGTALPGLFPQRIDASGCNRTAQAALSRAAAAYDEKLQQKKATDLKDEPQGYSPPVPKHMQGRGNQKEMADLEFRVVPASRQGDPAKAEFRDLPKRGKIAKREEDGMATEIKDFPLVPAGEQTSTQSASSARKRKTGSSKTYNSKGLETSEKSGRSTSAVGAPLTHDGKKADFECPHQGLTSGGYGMDDFSMGGSQDSTYEYFPKQYILLGGLEPKYKIINEKVIQGIKKYLLFRPMVPNNPDILFSGKAYSRDGTDEHLTYDWEVTHLTCFLGGMFGLSGKIFENPEDVEIGKKLADGCAWAYEAFPAGIMPEFAMITPCKNAKDCRWNETVWHQQLDPNWDTRDNDIEDYFQRKAEWESEMARLKTLEARRKEAEDAAKVERAANSSDMATVVPQTQTMPELKEKDLASLNRKREESKWKDETRRRLVEKEIDAKTKRLEQEFDGESQQTPIIYPVEPFRPKTHKEFVSSRIQNEHLLPGFITLNDRRYILRPEAIESIWYMYRITGDPIWQDKGWRMFEAVVKWTKTEAGHSAIDDVAFGEPGKVDSMESFWLAETLKYFYLLFETPDVISLDEWVLNTEAHPFKRPTVD